jgi:hypothetical protein
MRPAPSRTGSERELLDGFLDFHRETLLDKCAGLTPQQLGLRSVPPSTLSLHGLVRHLAGVERWWFRQQVCGMRLPTLNYTKDNPDLDFDDTDPDRWDHDLQVYRTEVQAAREAVAGLPLETVSEGPGSEPITLRWVYLHVITEYARHNGHADLLREAIDGAIGW